jgi:hypothetical protein
MCKEHIQKWKRQLVSILDGKECHRPWLTLSRRWRWVAAPMEKMEMVATIQKWGWKGGVIELSLLRAS